MLCSITQKLKHKLERLKVISLKPEVPSQGNVLVSYDTKPFLLESGETIPKSHTRYWESYQIAKTFLDLGYCVDVIHWTNKIFKPNKKYKYFIDGRWNLERLALHLNQDCIKIMHIDTAHTLFQNAAECNRLLQLQQRKGVTLKARRYEVPNLAIEHADCATILGNKFTISTFKYAKKPLYRIPISTPLLFPWPHKKNFEVCRKKFLWFSSGGLVLKGLDLLLDTFSEMPEYDLTICGPVKNEKDFEQAFYKELYETPNIHTLGWIDVESSKFIEIANSCISVIHPSCSEGGGGSVIGCMHAGLIPIVSYEASVDIEDEFGILLRNFSVDEIKKSIKAVSDFSTQELKLMSKRAWEFARKNHTQESFAQKYREFAEKITTIDLSLKSN